MKNENSSLSKILLQEFTRLAEWRGTVKEALKGIAAAVAKNQETNSEQWDAITEIRKNQALCKERCNKINSGKINKTDFLRYQNSYDTLDNRMDDQEKLQITQHMTLMFYGLIGGSLFTLFLFLAHELFVYISHIKGIL